MKFSYMLVSLFCLSAFIYSHTWVKLICIIFVDNPIFITGHVKLNLILCSNYQKFSINGRPINEVSEQWCLFSAYLYLPETWQSKKSSEPDSGLFPKVLGSLEPQQNESCQTSTRRFLSVYKTAAPGNYTYPSIHSTKTFFTSTMCKIERAACQKEGGNPSLMLSAFNQLTLQKICRFVNKCGQYSIE